MRFLFTFITCSVFFSTAFATNYSVRLVINSGIVSLSGGASVQGMTYSTSALFSQNSDLFIWLIGDDVDLKVVNFDSNVHGFKIDGIVDYGSIPVGDSVEQNIAFNAEGILRYYDPLNYPYNEYLGLSGIIHIKNPTDVIDYFYWDIREFDENWNSLINSGGSPVLNTFDPAYFTINGNSNPDINLDPIARVTGTIGNEFRIVLVNNGMSIHSMHFHGYHLFILDDSKNPSAIGREKDTFPLYPKEILLISCIPDKEGEYPVHDHNLVAVTGGTQYANGMFTTLLISP